MRTKDFSARVRAAGPADGLEEGQFVAIVSVFGNEDSMGDVVIPGAFTETLAEWTAKGDPLPVIWSHCWGDPFAHIGTVIKAVETLQGLEVTGQIDDLGDNPTSDQVYRLLKGRRVTQFSFAYDVLEDAWVEDRESRWGGYRELRKLKLHEVGPTLVGANQETELIAAKANDLAQGVKAGRVLAQAHVDRLKEAHKALGEVIDAAEPKKTATPPSPAGPQENEGTEQQDETPGQPGSTAAGGEQPSAQAGDTQPAKGATEPDNDARITNEDMRAIAQYLAAELAKSAQPAPDDSSTEDETTPGPREEAPEGAAKASPASLRLRDEFRLIALDASTLTD